MRTTRDLTPADVDASDATPNQAGPQIATATSGGTALVREATAHLTQIDLARRWRMSERTLEAWRWRRKGPPYLRIGGKIVYRLRDVLAFEMARLRQSEGE